jgi:hypothetical protein
VMLLCCVFMLHSQLVCTRPFASTCSTTPILHHVHAASAVHLADNLPCGDQGQSVCSICWRVVHCSRVALVALDGSSAVQTASRNVQLDTHKRTMPSMSRATLGQCVCVHEHNPNTSGRLWHATSQQHTDNHTSSGPVAMNGPCLRGCHSSYQYSIFLICHPYNTQLLSL